MNIQELMERLQAYFESKEKPTFYFKADEASKLGLTAKQSGASFRLMALKNLEFVRFRVEAHSKSSGKRVWRVERK